DNRQVRARHGFVETYDDVASVHAISVTHTKFADDAAGWVLNFFDIRIDHKGARGDDRARNHRRCAPAAHTDDQDEDYRRGDDEVPTHGVPRSRCALHDEAFPLSDTTLSGRGGAGTSRWRTLLRISSFGPSACGRPCLSTSRRSTPAMA